MLLFQENRCIDICLKNSNPYVRLAVEDLRKDFLSVSRLTDVPAIVEKENDYCLIIEENQGVEDPIEDEAFSIICQGGKIRISANGYTADQCITMEDAQRFTDDGTLLSHLLPVHTAFAHLPKLEVGEWQGRMLSNGVPLSLKKLGKLDPVSYTIWYNGNFLGVGTVFEEEQCMRLKRF